MATSVPAQGCYPGVSILKENRLELASVTCALNEGTGLDLALSNAHAVMH